MQNVSSISLAINYPTLVSVPHSIVNGFKNLLAIAVVTDIDFAEAEAVGIFYMLYIKFLIHVVHVHPTNKTVNL